ncbi:hypothetical protein [Larkinella rosea]|uniref:DUF4386 family protein n=1 Tax=Larkinella rosea TaxID=2025312 RepID=A0A3P1C272_9BACT|nr:hypothetical protein [Larkinella rosea]RRB07368.1 hypothetical protein EHT25_06205 [Larkinella rosea]
MNTESLNREGFWFPGRWVGGLALVIAPLLLLSGELLRFPFDFFFPSQLKAYDQHPTQMITSYSLFLAGNLLLWPAISTVAKLIGQSKPGWAVWGGTLVILGLFARTFHYGINHLAFQLVRIQDLDQASRAIADSYGAFHIVSILSGAIMAGWVVLAIGAYWSGTLGLIRSIALAAMSGLMLGVLKGSSVVSILAVSGLCIALIPLGMTVLSDGPKPEIRTILSWSAGMVLLITFMYFLGQAG